MTDSSRLLGVLFAMAVSAVGIGCGSGSGAGAQGGGGAGAGMSNGPGSGSGSGAGMGSGGTSSTGANTGGSTGTGRLSPPTSCTPTIQAADTSSPTTVVGTGAGTCTAKALQDAVTKGGIITFDCGGAATIPITSQIEAPNFDPNVMKGFPDTVIDGGGQITLDGGGTTRIFYFNSTNYDKTMVTFTIQNITLQNGKATGKMLPTADPPCSQGFDLTGSGGAIWIRDGILNVVNTTFTNNLAASPGPDVGGGAIYGTGSLAMTIVGSTFTGNSGSNGGAIGSLNSNLALFNDTFTNNQATGSGENYIDPTCMVNGGESGNGGNSGAVGIDGGFGDAVTVCGCTFKNNSAGALAGAIGRTPDGPTEPTNIDLSTFDGNTSVKGGGALYMHNSKLNITGTTFSNNSAPGAGGIQADGTDFAFTNVTFTGNSAKNGLGGAVSLFGATGTLANGGTLTNCTFANNHSDAGSGLFAAAIAGDTPFTIDNSVFSNNTSMDCGAPMACQDGTSDGSDTLQWPADHIVCTTADTPCAGAGTTFMDPLLGSLANNGGMTETIAPMSGSPAIGIGMNCPTVDQRGNARPANKCTAGAYEAP